MPLPLLPVVALGAPLLARFLSVAFIVGLVAKILVALGLSFFVFKGVDIGVDHLQNVMNNNLSGMASNVKSLLDTGGVTTVIAWLIKAYTLRLTIVLSKFALFRTKGLRP